MLAVLTIARYPSRNIIFGLLSMMIFRFPLWFNKKIRFWKLLGCGRNGTFDMRPDWNHWGILVVLEKDQIANSFSSPAGIIEISDQAYPVFIKQFYGSFISRWWKLCGCETRSLVLQPYEGHGRWNGKQAFGPLNQSQVPAGTIAVLTRATIRLTKLKSFWKNVSPVAIAMKKANGLVWSVGIGETPLFRQATLSIWRDRESMNGFAYQIREHQQVIHKTREERWYSEEMFVRFGVIAISPEIKSIDFHL